MTENLRRRGTLSQNYVNRICNRTTKGRRFVRFPWYEWKKFIVCKRVRQHYERLQHEAGHCCKNLTSLQYKGPGALKQQKQRIQELEKTDLPKMQKQLETNQNALKKLHSIVQALEQAIKFEQQKQQKQALQQDRTKKRLRTISTNRSQGPELGM